jgi:hypothetical protein
MAKKLLYCGGDEVSAKVQLAAQLTRAALAKYPSENWPSWLKKNGTNSRSQFETLANAAPNLRKGRSICRFLKYLFNINDSLAERVSNSVYITLGCTRSPMFKKPLSRRRELCAGPLVHSLQFARNLHANMGRCMGENVRRKVGFSWEQIAHLARAPICFFGAEQ